MSTTAPKPVTTPIPVQLSEPGFEAFILPHLSMPKRGPKCKLGYYRVFNLILWVLYTGMQWKSSHSIKFSGSGPSSLLMVLKCLGLPPCWVMYSKDPITWGTHASHTQTATCQPDHHH